MKTYILASKRNGTLYIGVTNDLFKRVYQHKNDVVEGFTKKYGVHTLVYWEQCESIESAIQREKQLKVWQRKWKIRLIKKQILNGKICSKNLLDSSLRWNDNLF